MVVLELQKTMAGKELEECLQATTAIYMISWYNVANEPCSDGRKSVSRLIMEGSSHTKIFASDQPKKNCQGSAEIVQR